MNKVQKFSTLLSTNNLSTRKKKKKKSPEYPCNKCEKREGRGLRFLGCP